MEFDHVGYRSYEKREDEMYYAPNKVWITDSSRHPFRVEWLRYEDDSPVPEIVKNLPHLGFIVEDIEAASRGMELLLGPMAVDQSTTVAFYLTADGAVVEFKEVRKQS